MIQFSAPYIDTVHCIIYSVAFSIYLFLPFLPVFRKAVSLLIKHISCKYELNELLSRKYRRCRKDLTIVIYRKRWMNRFRRVNSVRSRMAESFCRPKIDLCTIEITFSKIRRWPPVRKHFNNKYRNEFNRNKKRFTKNCQIKFIANFVIETPKIKLN